MLTKDASACRRRSDSRNARAARTSPSRLSFHAAMASAISGGVEDRASGSSVICCRAEAVPWSRAGSAPSCCRGHREWRLGGDLARQCASACSSIAPWSASTALTRAGLERGFCVDALAGVGHLARHALRHDPVRGAAASPRSAIMPMWISCTGEEGVGAVDAACRRRWRGSERAADAAAPARRRITGKRASSSALKQSIRRRSDPWKLRRARAARRASAATHLPSDEAPNTSRRHAGAENAVPVEDHQRRVCASVLQVAPRRAAPGR